MDVHVDAYSYPSPGGTFSLLWLWMIQKFFGSFFFVVPEFGIASIWERKKKNYLTCTNIQQIEKKYTSNIVHIYPNGEFFFCSSKNIRIPRAISNGDEAQQKRREEQILQSEERLLLACFSFVLRAYLRFAPPPPISKSPSLALFNRSPRSSILDGLYVWACLCGLLLYW